MEISVKWVLIGILIFKVSIASCFYPEYIVEDICKSGNETVLYGLSNLSLFGTLKATSFPPYKPNKNCTIILQPPSGKGIVLSVRKIDMRETLFSCADYLKVYHNDVFTSPTQLCRFKYDLKEKVSFYSKGPMIIIFYVSPDAYPTFTREEGFTLTYTVVSEDIQDCIGDDKYMCSNTRCISKDLLCDGRNNCGDRSDESQELCSLTNTFYVLQMTDVIYGIVFSLLILSIIISVGIVLFRRRRPILDTDSVSDIDEPTARLTPYQAVHPKGFFICQNPAGPDNDSLHSDGGFTNPCYPHGFPQPPPPYSQ